MTKTGEFMFFLNTLYKNLRVLRALVVKSRLWVCQTFVVTHIVGFKVHVLATTGYSLLAIH